MNPIDETIRELIMEKCKHEKYEIDEFIKSPDDLDVRAFIVNTKDLDVPPEQLRHANSQILICRHLSAVHKKKKNLDHYVDLVWYSDFIDPDIKVWVKMEELCQIFCQDVEMLKEQLNQGFLNCLLLDNDVYLSWSQVQDSFGYSAKNFVDFT